MNLLIVNDAVLAAESMKEEIPWSNYGISHCYTAYNVPDAQEIIRSLPIDVLLCDIEMPGQNGLELIRWIRENQFPTESILLTCHADFEYAREAVVLGCQNYLLIPASYEDVGNTVARVVHRILEKQDKEKLQEYGRSWLQSQEAAASSNTQPAKSPKEVVEECCAYILHHLSDEHLSVNDLAAHYYLNPIYLNRIFKKEKNIAISQYIIREKMSLASQLLKNSSLNAVAVAKQVGYPNYSYFSSSFKKYYGCTPAQYRDASDNV